MEFRSSNTVSWVIALAALLPAGAEAAAESHSPRGPATLVASSDGKTLFVANADARQIAVVDVADRRVVSSIDVPAPPSGLALSSEKGGLVCNVRRAR